MDCKETKSAESSLTSSAPQIHLVLRMPEVQNNIYFFVYVGDPDLMSLGGSFLGSSLVVVNAKRKENRR